MNLANTFGLVGLASMLLTTGIASGQDQDARSGADTCRSESVVPLTGAANGDARLCRSERGLSAQISVQDLVAGHAYTVWWVYFDDPASCVTPNMCDLVDFAGDNPLAVFGRMDGMIAGPLGRGQFFGRFRDMTPTEGSQVWLLIFGHGPADHDDKRHLARQLLTPEDPHAGTPHLGNVVDGALGFPEAVAVFTLSAPASQP